MKIYTSTQMRAAEQAAVERGTSFEQLMENAGQSAAADILRRHPHAGTALVVCGKGNNGGDGLVIARVLQQHGWCVDIALVLGTKLSALAELNRQRLMGLSHIEWLDGEALLGRLNTAERYSIIIEGIFGTGFSGQLPEQIATVCRQLNRADGLKIALDIPTGLNGDTGECDAHTFQADLTYTFGAYKPAHFQPNGQTACGEVVCLDIGL